jgi:hypothetical protein
MLRLRIRGIGQIRASPGLVDDDPPGEFGEAAAVYPTALGLSGETRRRDATRFDRLPRQARRQGRSGEAEVDPRPDSLPRTETDAGPELRRVADLNHELVAGVPSPGINLRRSDRPKQPTMSLRASVSSDRSAQMGTQVGSVLTPEHRNRPKSPSPALDRDDDRRSDS